MQPRKSIPKALRDAVIARDGHVCQLCRCPVVLGGDPNAPDTLNLDHVIQFAIGGADTLENLRVVCARCNWHRPKPVTEEQAARRRRDAPLAAERRARRRLAAYGPEVPLRPPRVYITARKRREAAAEQ